MAHFTKEANYHELANAAIYLVHILAGGLTSLQPKTRTYFAKKNKAPRRNGSHILAAKVLCVFNSLSGKKQINSKVKKRGFQHSHLSLCPTQNGKLWSGPCRFRSIQGLSISDGYKLLCLWHIRFILVSKEFA